MTLSVYPLVLAAEAVLDEGSASELQIATLRFEEVTKLAPALRTTILRNLSVPYGDGPARHFPSSVAVSRAKAAALHAMELNSEMIEAYSCLGCAQALEWDWPNAEKSFQHALSLGAHVVASRQYALLLTAMRRFDEASQHLEMAQRTDPFSYRQKVARTKFLYLTRRYQEGVRQVSEPLIYGRPLPMESRFNIALMFVQIGNIENAKQLADSIRPDSGAQMAMMAGIAEILASSGEKERAKEIVGDFKLFAPVPPISKYRQALLALALGERKQSLSLLTAAVKDREAELVWIAVDPRFDPIREEPIFVRLLKDVFPVSSK